MEPKEFYKKQDPAIDQALRPRTFDEYVGQQRIKKSLAISIKAAKARNETLGHVLLYGPSGLGKTTLAHLIAAEVGGNLQATSGATIERVGDIAALLTNLEPGSVLFIDEVHRLPRTVEEVLYPAMETRKLDIILGKGLAARSLELSLPPFTLIAATTRIGLLSNPLRSRFASTFRLDFYTQEEIESLLARSAVILGVKIQKKALEALAQASRATPRIANHLLKYVRDLAQVRGAKEISLALTKEALSLLEIDQLGLQETDRKILRLIIEKFNGGPVGLQALAASLTEEPETILEVWEPYLLRIGFLVRTPRGRVATAKSFEHLGISPPEQGLPL